MCALASMGPACAFYELPIAREISVESEILVESEVSAESEVFVERQLRATATYANCVRQLRAITLRESCVRQLRVQKMFHVKHFGRASACG